MMTYQFSILIYEDGGGATISDPFTLTDGSQTLGVGGKIYKR